MIIDQGVPMTDANTVFSKLLLWSYDSSAKVLLVNQRRLLDASRKRMDEIRDRFREHQDHALKVAENALTVVRNQAEQSDRRIAGLYRFGDDWNKRESRPSKVRANVRDGRKRGIKRAEG
jgi:hypothetical protein